MISTEEFQKVAPQKLDWLVENGFKRAKDFEKSSPTVATLVYCGKNVAFEFSLDIRDQCIGAEVIKVKSGQLLRNMDGGYSSDVFNHLVKYEGYRGNPRGEFTESESLNYTQLDAAIEGWISLISTAGSNLLSDQPVTLDPS